MTSVRWNVGVALVAALLAASCSDESPTRGDGAVGDGAVGDGAVTADAMDASVDDGPATDQSSAGAFPDKQSSRYWIHVSETSALIYWQTGDMKTAATSHVEYGPTASHGSKTSPTTASRWAQLHRITGLTPQTPYHFRMVMTPDGQGEVRSPDESFTTKSFPAAVRLPGGLGGPPYILDKDDTLYLLTQDISAGGTAVEVTGKNVVLELDGHSVTFGTSSGGQVFGIHVKGTGQAVVRNGHVIQGTAAGDYSSCVETRWRAAPIEVFGVTTAVQQPNGYPLRLFGSAQDAKIHHNHFRSAVTEIESRHYPGNDLLRIDASGPNISVEDNLLTEGAHRGIAVTGTGGSVEVAHNDIRHHARYVNGYALACSATGGMKVHHNRVTSTGRGVHLTAADIELHDNHLDTKGHMTLDDYPQGTKPFKERMIELHGIKLEGSSVTGAKVYNNYVRITQHIPDADWEYVPPTPLNIASYDRNAMNEIYNNTFVALTYYKETYHGGYGDSGQWASPLYFVSMDKGAADAGKYSVYIHDNELISNDLFVSATAAVNMTVRVEKNSFTLATTPPPTTTHTPFRNIGTALETVIKQGSNVFVGMAP